jgi:hypothetical protein
MSDNLPKDFKDMEDDAIVGEDSRAMQLTHYVLAERLIQCEYARIKHEINNESSSDILTYILEGGHRGYHKYTAGELWSEWKDGSEDYWYQLYEDGELPWEPFDEDPIVALEKDENGEVKTYGQRLAESSAE